MESYSVNLAVGIQKQSNPSCSSSRKGPEDRQPCERERVTSFGRIATGPVLFQLKERLEDRQHWKREGERERERGQERTLIGRIALLTTLRTNASGMEGNSQIVKEWRVRTLEKFSTALPLALSAHLLDRCIVSPFHLCPLHHLPHASCRLVPPRHHRVRSFGRGELVPVWGGGVFFGSGELVPCIVKIVSFRRGREGKKER